MSVLLIFVNLELRAQLCTGSLGDPVVNITFGSGNNPGLPLGTSITNYQYVGTDCPIDGSYTIRNQTANCFLNHWHTLTADHTGNPNGYFMLVNASYTPSDFYVQKVDGLCPNTTYEFAAWLLNMCNVPGTILPNVTFSIEKTDGTVLNTYNSGDIPTSATPKWVQYGFYFKTPANITSVVIRMKNNAPGGNGNDIALDDITFRPCGPKVNAGVNGNTTNRIDLCDGSTQSISIGSYLSAGYTQPVLQWQVSTDKGATWKDIPGANADSYLRTATHAGEFWYRLTVAEADNITIPTCRVASDPVMIIVHALPTVHLNVNPTVCEGTNLTLRADVNYNSGPVRNLIWTYPTSNLPVAATEIQNNDTANTGKIMQTVGPMPIAGTGKYYLTVQNSFGCQNADSASLVVNPKPVADFSFQTPLCEKSEIGFSNLSKGQYSITKNAWLFGDSTGSSAQDPSHAFNNAGNFDVSLVVTDVNGCKSDTALKALAIHAAPTPDFLMPRLCLSDPAAQFVDSSSISDHTEAGFSYLWHFGDPANASTNTSNLKNPTHQYATVGDYPVTLNVTSQNGCTRDTTKTFTLNGSAVNASFTLNNASPLCSADSIAITNTSSVNFGSLVEVSISWDYANDPTASDTDHQPSPGKTYEHSFSSQIAAPSRDVTVHLVASSGLHCVATADKVLHINKSPEIRLDPINRTCVNDSAFALTQASDLSGTVGLGSYSGAGVANNIFSPGIAGPGDHDISYTFVTDAGCSAQQEQTIHVLPKPSVDAGADKTIIKGEWTTLNGQASGNGPLHFDWSPPGQIDNSTAANPRVAPMLSTNYVLTVTSVDGCSNTDSVTVTVLNGLFIPTAFSPNGDGLNDVWRLPLLDSYPNTEVWIYDRWGNLVFHAKGPQVMWDGKCKGVIQPAGTYVYLIDLKASSAVYKGTLSLIR